MMSTWETHSVPLPMWPRRRRTRKWRLWRHMPPPHVLPPPFMDCVGLDYAILKMVMVTGVRQTPSQLSGASVKIYHNMCNVQVYSSRTMREIGDAGCFRARDAATLSMFATSQSGQLKCNSLNNGVLGSVGAARTSSVIRRLLCPLV